MSESQTADGALTDAGAAEHFPCPGCSAGMVYDPASHAMKCPFCGTVEKISGEGSGSVAQKNPLFPALEAGQGVLQRLSGKALQVPCNQCGTAVIFEPPEVAGACPFCGSALVTQPTAAEEQLPPDAVLPALLAKDQAQQEVKQWLQTRWFAPNGLKKLARPEGIQGVYLPFWSYDALTMSRYIGQRGEYYYETEYYTETDSEGKTVQRSRQVRRTRWYPAFGTVSVPFQNMLIAASRAVQEKRLDDLEPWWLDKLQPYASAYLAGFKAQSYQVSLGAGFKEAQQRMEPVIHRAVCCDIGGDEQVVTSVNTSYLNAGFQHLLLPTWIGAYRFNGKTYQVVVNASTGEVQGERPYSFWKIFSLVVAAILAILLLILTFSDQQQRRQAEPPVDQPLITEPPPAPPMVEPTVPREGRKPVTRNLHKAAPQDQSSQDDPEQDSTPKNHKRRAPKTDEE